MRSFETMQPVSSSSVTENMKVNLSARIMAVDCIVMIVSVTASALTGDAILL
jgi:hypothetical protein